MHITETNVKIYKRLSEIALVLPIAPPPSLSPSPGHGPTGQQTTITLPDNPGRGVAKTTQIIGPEITELTTAILIKMLDVH